MPITITCIDGVQNFMCCDGGSGEYNFEGLRIYDGVNHMLFNNPIKLAKKASSVLVWDGDGSYKDIPVSEVDGVSTVNQLVATIASCRQVTGGGFSREVAFNVTNSFTLYNVTVPDDRTKMVVFVGGVIATEFVNYTVSGQTITLTENADSEIVQVFIFQ